LKCVEELYVLSERDAAVMTPEKYTVNYHYISLLYITMRKGNRLLVKDQSSVRIARSYVWY